MRPTASILHLDLDAFFAAVEQRDKPSLRGKAVIVGGVGQRGVVSTASYEARAFGVRSAMPSHEARRRAPHAAFLGGRFDAYRQSSRIVMALLHELSPLVEPLSIDEAFVDLEAGGHDCHDLEQLRALGQRLRADLYERTEGLTASVGVGSSKFIAKVASEMAKPNGLVVVPPGGEVAAISPLPARAVPGVGPVTMEKLDRLGIKTVADLQRAEVAELSREVGRSWGEPLHELAFARDDRPVSPHREAKSISVEDTFETDLTDRAELERIAVRDAGIVAGRLQASGQFARTITLKVRLGDFTTWTRSRTLHGATDNAERVAQVARELLAALDVREGVRLLGVGVANFTQAAQEELFVLDGDEVVIEDHTSTEPPPQRVRHRGDWYPGSEVEHPDFGRGWVWGSGLGRVTVRFETRLTGVGPVRTFRTDDENLTRPDGPVPMTWEVTEPGE
ncbi:MULTISPECIES: DNA polymerase IV [unclassified Luteococcus]|uniref:DNA polymerase IV n=1 Tax=unclassified Luteococcus TaxID=2639923 RepID=UPI00313A9324